MRAPLAPSIWPRPSAALPAPAPRTAARRSWLAIAAIAALAAAPAGCKKKDDAGAAAGSAAAGSAATSSGAAAAAGSGSAAAAPVPAGSVQIFVDGQPVAVVTPDQIAKWPRVDTLVPEDARRLGTWAMVELGGAKPTSVKRPSQSHPDMVPALFPGEGGAPAFGMFDPVEHARRGTPALRADGITELRLQLASEGRGGDHQGGASPGADPTKIVLPIKTPAGERKLTGEQILALPRTPQPGTEDTRGWPLLQLLEAAGVTKFEQLTLLDASGTGSLILLRKEIDAKSVPFVKLNKAGDLRLRVLKQAGTGWSTAGELRALAAIEVK